MTGDMSSVVAQLLEVRERLATTAVVAMRAKADTQVSLGHYAEATKGASRSRLEQAKTDIEIAGAKAAKVAGLLSKARDHISAYVDKIAPGSIGGKDDPVDAMPSGEELVEDAERRADATPSWASFVRKATRNADNIQDSTKTVAEVAEQGFKILRNPSGPSGTQTTGTPTTPTAATPTARAKIDIPDTASHLLVVGITAIVAAQKADQLFRKGFARLRNRWTHRQN
ncbi:hypothetical protein O7626_07015 [Micromonospora sp. WMMD1102]|uniref:hypothetical protein n=1 Tax=Micromonospora sp. WMMD1102 TaxID=3016105 RepID=UPI0024150510|nr:hypothetical protein [Micromonospora sp. WMMD1102]MDG4785683.1 hypothetical protein [Micromonospora sp. WMMD1102]